jgi:hypothetical protein
VFCKAHVHGAEVDYWGLGVLAYELLFGKRPFDKHCPTVFIQYLENAYAMMQKKLARVERTKRCSDKTFINPSPPPVGHESEGICSSQRARSRQGSPTVSAVLVTSHDGLPSCGSPARSVRDSGPLTCGSPGKPFPAMDWSPHFHGKASSDKFSSSVGRNSEQSDNGTWKNSSGGDSDAEISSQYGGSVCGRVSNIGSYSSMGSCGSPALSMMYPSPSRFGRTSGVGSGSDCGDHHGYQDYGCAMGDRNMVHHGSGCLSGTTSPAPILEDSSSDDGDYYPHSELYEDHWAVTCGELPSQMRVQIPESNQFVGHISANCVSMLEGLFEVRPSLRLGCRNIAALQSHPYLHSRGYDHLEELVKRKIPPPLVPGRRASILSKDIDPAQLALLVNGVQSASLLDNEEVSSVQFISPQEQLKFKDFHFVSKYFADDWNANNPSPAKLMFPDSSLVIGSENKSTSALPAFGEATKRSPYSNSMSSSGAGAHGSSHLGSGLSSLFSSFSGRGKGRAKVAASLSEDRSSGQNTAKDASNVKCTLERLADNDHVDVKDEQQVLASPTRSPSKSGKGLDGRPPIYNNRLPKISAN